MGERLVRLRRSIVIGAEELMAIKCPHELSRQHRICAQTINLGSREGWRLKAEGYRLYAVSLHVAVSDKGQG